MNVIEQARQAYAPTQMAIRSDRAIEAQLLSQVTARLRRSMTENGVNFPALARAIYDNRRIWATLAISVADQDNRLPDDLRAKLFYLAEFTEHHSAKVLAGAADARALIDVNTAVMRGLNGQVTP